MKPSPLVFLLLLIAGCNLLPGDSIPSIDATPTPVLFAEDTARAFLKAWSEKDYPAMYLMVAPSRQDTISVDQFVTRYKDIAQEARFKKISTTILSTREEGNEAEIKFAATI